MKKKERTLQKQPAIINLSRRVGLIKQAESSEPLAKRTTGIRYGLAWIAEYAGTTYFGWLLVNMMADFGTRPNRPNRFNHSDWSLQTQDLIVNLCVLTIIFTAQLFKFNFQLVRDRDYKGKIVKGRFYFVPLLTAGLLTGVLYFRLNHLPQVEYDLFIPNALAFSLFWIFVSTLSFFGYKGLWTAILLAILKGKKGEA